MLLRRVKAKAYTIVSLELQPSYFFKDIVLHATDSHTENSKAADLNAMELALGLPPQIGDGIELMIPADLGDFLPTIIQNLIERKIDISAELSAGIRCACKICDSSN
ncbi:unnamed protein product [Urochloa humidicola]